MSSGALENRVAAIESELARLKARVETTAVGKPWWEQIAGTFENDRVYLRAMKMGRQYRQSLDPAKPSRRRK
jgi:hypothetical protein